MLHKYFILFNFFVLTNFVYSENWNTLNYPNPTKDGFQQCNMRSIAQLCDPDAVFTESERSRLNYEINTLERKTRQNGDNFCTKKGIVAAIAIAKRVQGNSETAVKTMANEMLQKWNLDKQCEKSIVIVLATDDKKFWVARDARVPVYATEFTNLFNSQKTLLKKGAYYEALLNIINDIAKKALEKQAPVSNNVEPVKPSSTQKNNFNPLTMLSKIPLLLWLIIIFILIPTLCCCCCLYLCCCRKKNVPSNIEQNTGKDYSNTNPNVEGNSNQQSNGFNRLLTGLGGSAMIGTVSNWFQNRGNKNQQNLNQNNGYQQGVPQNQKGLYPSLEVKDEGAGGQW